MDHEKAKVWASYMETSSDDGLRNMARCYLDLVRTLDETAMLLSEIARLRNALADYRSEAGHG